MNINNLFIHLSILLIFSLPSPSFSERCNPQDKKALLQIFKELYNLDDSDLSWDCCNSPDDEMVKCDTKTNRVTELYITFKDAGGRQIPPSLGNLEYLQVLSFGFVTNLTGTIPESITNLKYLEYLLLPHNNLSAQIPSFLGNIKTLKKLDLSNNAFTGSIPASLSQLHHLTHLYLDDNRLTGNIPKNLFWNLAGTTPPLHPSLRTLSVSNNQLTGEVPESIGKLNLETLGLSGNKLAGDVSFLFGRNKSLRTVDLSGNLFEFDLSKIKVPKGVVYFDLNHNKIYGKLPVEMTGLDLFLFNVSYNRLCGQIPVGGQLQSFEATAYLHNRCLCGAPLPPCKSIQS